jgi:hypothetical protein
MCTRNKDGGLRVRRLREFNVALLGKWCYRMLVDKGVLWYRVLSARYGVDGGRVLEGIRRRSGWWKYMVCNRDGGGGWSQDNVF